MIAIEDKFEPLRQTPRPSPSRDAFAAGLRVVFHNYCTPLADAIVIVRVLHGARDAMAMPMKADLSPNRGSS